MSRSPAPRRRATLASLAAELKVSRTTISNAYNRPDQLSAELRERVLAAAKRLGYPGPDPVARSLRTRRAGAVGLVITEPLTYAFSDPAALNFVAGLAESCEEFGKRALSPEEWETFSGMLSFVPQSAGPPADSNGRGRAPGASR